MPNRSDHAQGEKTFRVAGQAIAAADLPPGLYVVATPIGNLGDITLRALAILASADVIACEDTRVSRRLLQAYGISTQFTPYHEHNADQARPRIMARLKAGERVALISDAGTPLISDPGFKLVRAAREAGYHVSAAPGPSSVLMALAVSGLPTDRFFFEGFLPAKAGARRTRIAELARIPATLALFETGPRLAATLHDLAEALGGREAALCRELTKFHEQVRRGALPELAKAYAEEEPPRGEMVIVIDAPRKEPAAADVEALLRPALQRLTLKDAVAEVASMTGQARREVYRRALALQDEAKAR